MAKATALPDVLPVIGLDGIVLKEGSHEARERGVCAMEAVAWLAGEKHSDAPRCACPVILHRGVTTKKGQSGSRRSSPCHHTSTEDAQ